MDITDNKSTIICLAHSTNLNECTTKCYYLSSNSIKQSETRNLC